MASRSHKEFLSILISLCGADANQRDGNGCTALFFIVTLGYAECMEKLLSCGGLTDAVRSERRDLVRWWLELYGDKVDKDGKSELHVAAATRSVDICSNLVNNKARVNKLVVGLGGKVPSPLLDVAV